MSLEKDMVFQLKEQGNYSDEDILKVCDEYLHDSRIALPINKEQTQKEIERYELLRQYFLQTKNKRMLKKIFQKRTKDTISGKVKEMLSEPDVIAVRRVTIKPKIYAGRGYGLELCGNCLEPFGIREAYAIGTSLKKLGNGRMKREKWGEHFLSFCVRCQSIFDEYGNNLYEDKS